MSFSSELPETEFLGRGNKALGKSVWKSYYSPDESPYNFFSFTYTISQIPDIKFNNKFDLYQNMSLIYLKLRNELLIKRLFALNDKTPSNFLEAPLLPFFLLTHIAQSRRIFPWYQFSKNLSIFLGLL